MQPDKWEQVKGQLQDVFSDVEFDKASLPEPQMGEIETVLFTGPLGKTKLEYTTKPVILDKRTSGSRRIGSSPSVEYVYSRTETTSHMKAFVWKDDQDDWVEIDMKESFNL
jgi:hypothetical protein